MSSDGVRKPESWSGTSACPHCGRPWDDHGPTTTVLCGACDATRVMAGTRQTVADTVWECDECGQLNHVPNLEEVADGV